MTSRAIVNIIYAPQQKPPHKMFENENGELWRGASYDKKKINVGMGWYSLKNPKPYDSIWVMEPYCVLEKDYDYRFVNNFQYIFTWATKAFTHDKLQNKIVQTNHPSYHQFPSMEHLTKNWVEWKQKKNEIVFIANNKSSGHHSELYSLRLQLADLLHKKSKFEVSWYAQIPIKRPYFKGWAKSKADAIGRAKFSVCTENSYDQIYTHGYFTEKMPDVWKAGTIPIYMGCYNIDDFGFPNNSYIDLRNYVRKDGKKFVINEKALISRIENFSEPQYIHWANAVKHHILKPQKIKQIASFDTAYETIVNKFHKDLLRAELSIKNLGHK